MSYVQKKYSITKHDYKRLQCIIESFNTDESANSVRRLREKFKKARFIDRRNIKATVVTMNSKVRLINIGNGSREEYVLVFPEESDPPTNKISIFDNMGCELFSHEVGEVVRLNHFCEDYFLIESILYQPEAAGDYSL